jgi:hypothetical protein
MMEKATVSKMLEIQRVLRKLYCIDMKASDLLKEERRLVAEFASFIG